MTTDDVYFPVRHVRTAWRGLSLARQYALAASIVVLLGTLTIGFWVADRIERGVVENTGIAVAFYMDGLIEPLVQDLASGDELSAEKVKELDKLLQHKSVGARVVAIKIWKKGAVIAYSNQKDVIGKKFIPTENLKQAWQGIISAEFGHVHHGESIHEISRGKHVLEVYAPIREFNSERVIAVAEFYHTGDALTRDLNDATRYSWMVVGGTGLVIMASLFWIVLSGSNTIAHQRKSLESQVGRLEALLAQNEILRRRLGRGYQEAAELNERYLRRLGAELHDGPAQLLGLALLRFDSISLPQAGPESDHKSIDIVRKAMSDALHEIRHLCAGLALPELEGRTLDDAIRQLVRNHESRTSTQVETQIDTFSEDLSGAVRICLFRMTQEALNNAYRHAEGRSQSVTLHAAGRKIVLTVADDGPGFDVDATNQAGNRIGLKGLRERVETLGGVFEIKSQPNEGTKLTATFDLDHLKGSGLHDA